MKTFRLVHARFAPLALVACVGGCGSSAASGPDGGGAGDAPASVDGAVGVDATAGGCDPVSPVDGLTLHVNPIDGDDTAGTGSGSAGGVARATCAFRSITRAADVAGVLAKTSMKIVVDVTASVGTGETFPIAIPPDTTLSPGPGALVAVVVGSGDGLHLQGGSSAVESLVVDGQNAAANGVVVTAGPTRLAGVEVRGFTSAGVRADVGAQLTITARANLHDDGAGLVATGTAAVSIDGVDATEQQPTRIAANGGHGIEVRGSARVDVTGTPSSLTPGAGTVVVADNTLDGVVVEQVLVAQGAPGPAGMMMTGLVATRNGGSGLHVFGGSGVKVRGSYLSHNGLHGVFVQTDPDFISGGAGANDGNDIGRIDLGVGGDPGHDVLVDNASPNAKKGVCLEVTSGSGLNGPLNLMGNVFATGGSSVDCAQIAGSLPATGDCTAAGPLGDVGRNPKNDLNVSLCVVP
jgi:hypothetical protein